MARLVDVTLPLASDLPVWPGDTPIAIAPTERLRDGAGSNVSALTCSTHAGTHVDAPRHVLAGGGPVDAIDLELLVGPAWIADLTGVRGEISAQALADAGVPEGTTRLLVRTRNSGTVRRGGAFPTGFVALSLEAGDWVVGRGIRLVGVDGPSIEAYGHEDLPLHRALLGAGVVVVETLDLGRVPPGPCEVFCLPLRIAGGDGSPARVLIRPP